ncbi:hypothetical protein HPB49_016917 [Dermacentor silvarum]|uniref:Uncharacterized protein n=1 Tax=Dermacentor silvarum TaxID=543639 RepID=A0ACB8D6U7_DERSI|nr:uncharacterized protein LOC119445647 isoform X1 [Dermacentor silvarum]KAH7960095.1 hypothetical protein HPB49_016917 [Dermacentor silvarum]
MTDCNDPVEAEADVLKRHLRGLRKRGSLWTGYTESLEAFTDFLHDLAQINITFRTEHSAKQNGRLLMASRRGDVVVDENIPFTVLRNSKRSCIFGWELKKLQGPGSSQVTEAEQSAASSSQKKRKLGCTAMMRVKQVEIYPEYRINRPPGRTKHERDTASRQQISRLKLALQEEGSIQTVLRQERFYISMSDIKSHCNHDISRCVRSTQPIEPKLATKIVELVRQGMTAVKAMESHLKCYVKDVLFLNKPCPLVSSRYYYPSEWDIRKHIRQALQKCRFNSTDQDSAAKYVEELREKTPTTNCFFRSCEMRREEDNQLLPVQQDQTDWDILESVAQDCHSTLLFCIQTNFMRELLLKYSSNVVCLDATYKTTECALPLFFIIVKTTSCYAVVGAFVVQFETAECIGEALSIWRAWNSDLNPKFWMVDLNQAEITALSNAFPCGRTIISDSHREQAWHRFFSTEENDVADVSAVEALLSQIADSQNEQDFKMALTSLKESPHWLQNHKLQKYITHWLSVKELWVKMYRLDLPYDCNNGADLKSYLARKCGNLSLSELVKALVEVCFPEMEAQFLQASISSPSHPLNNIFESPAVPKKEPDMISLSTTPSTFSEQFRESPARSDAEYIALDPHQPPQHSQHHLTSQIRTQTKKIASVLHYINDDAVLQEVLAMLTVAKALIRENLAINDVEI